MKMENKMNVYFYMNETPWKSTTRQLWAKTPAISKDIVVTNQYDDCDISIMEWDAYNPVSILGDKPLLVFVSGFNSDEDSKLFSETIDAKNSMVFVDTVEMYKRVEDLGFIGYIWSKILDVSDKFKFDSEKTLDKTENFAIVCNATNDSEMLAKVTRTYFEMCLVESESGVLIGKNSVQIYSAQELPFEPFNNIAFNELQPTPRVYQSIKRSKLFISTQDDDAICKMAMCATLIGTPILVCDNKANRAKFLWREHNFYSDEKDLAKKIKFYSELDINSDEYLNIIASNYAYSNKTYSDFNAIMSISAMASQLKHRLDSND